MRYAIMADIHANLAAFQAVLSDIERRQGVGQIWCLGDVVGYGPDPSECIALLREYDHLGVAGNHDWAAVGQVDTSDFNPDAAAACLWTGHQLSPEDRSYLENLPLTLEKGDFTLVHGSPRDPIWEYLLYAESACESFHHFKTSFCLIGHSHVPLVFEHRGDDIPPSLSDFPLGSTIKLGGRRLIVNPGGVGQPRDGDPRASYLVYDDAEGVIHHRRVPYDVAQTQKKMLGANLPVRLAARLSYGY